MTQTEYLLEMKKIRKEFPGVLALDGVDFNLRKGEVHVLLGENGAGKSTLMKILSGAYQKDGGEILIDGEPAGISSPSHAQALGIGIIYQEFTLNPHLSVAENIYLGREPVRLPGVINWKKLYRDARSILDDLDVKIDVRQKVASLGVAMQQMTEVAKALSQNARILVMDEPTAALSGREIEALFRTIAHLKSKGVGIVYISHRLEEIFEIGDRVTVLRDGRYVDTRSVKGLARNEMVRLMVNRDLDDHIPKVKSDPGDVVLRLEGVNVRDRLRDISFELRRGEVLGIAGLMGAGRTRLAKTVFGAERISGGRILVDGEEVNLKSPRDAINAGIGLVTEDRKSEGLILELSVKKNITLPNLNRFLSKGVLQLGREGKVADDYIRRLKIKTPSGNQRVVCLSGGNQQKVVLSKWLCTDARIFLFDEPTRGIDVGAKTEIYQLMNEITARGGAILMISSEMPEILGMSDRILVMRDGAVAGELAGADATQEQIMKLALGEWNEGEWNEAV